MPQTFKDPRQSASTATLSGWGGVHTISLCRVSLIPIPHNQLAPGGRDSQLFHQEIPGWRHSVADENGMISTGKRSGGKGFGHVRLNGNKGVLSGFTQGRDLPLEARSRHSGVWILKFKHWFDGIAGINELILWSGHGTRDCTRNNQLRDTCHPEIYPSHVLKKTTECAHEEAAKFLSTISGSCSEQYAESGTHFGDGPDFKAAKSGCRVNRTLESEGTSRIPKIPRNEKLALTLATEDERLTPASGDR